MGGRGSRSGKKAGTARISSIREIESQMGNALQRMESLARFATPAFYDENKSTQYYMAKREYDELRSRRNTLLNNQMKQNQNQNRNPPDRTFVNSFGEATKRHITTSTYERGLKRTAKRIEALLGVR